jgi:hypothetical protein
MVESGSLHAAQDFEEAAFVFQHGTTSDDYLLAHTLAVMAVARGRASAMWIATATLDRYLHTINQPQIYGTQTFRTPDNSWTQEPYNRTLVPDDLLRELGVDSRPKQQKRVDSLNSMKH